jgi:hypothetical protein
MASTTNYNWSTPDDTALVKDGASAMRTLGSSIDTTTKNLNPETTLGDISYRSSTANTKTRLAVGTSGQVLTVAAGVPAWADPTGGSMTLLASGTVISGNASLSLTSISGSYKDLRLVLKNWRPATDGSTGRMQFNSDTGSSYFRLGFNSADANESSFGSSFVGTLTTTDSTTNNGICVIDFYDYSNTVTWKSGLVLNLQSGDTTATNYSTTRGFWGFNSTAAISSILLYWSAGNLSGGTYELYGVK